MRQNFFQQNSDVIVDAANNHSKKSVHAGSEQGAISNAYWHASSEKFNLPRFCELDMKT